MDDITGLVKDLFEKNRLTVIIAAVVVVALIAVGAGLLLRGGSGDDNGYEIPAEDIGKNVIRYNYKITFDESFISKDGAKIDASAGKKFAIFEYKMKNSSVEEGFTTDGNFLNCWLNIGTTSYYKTTDKHPGYHDAEWLSLGKSFTSVFVFEVPESAVIDDFTPKFTHTNISDPEPEFKLDEDIIV